MHPQTTVYVDYSIVLLCLLRQADGHKDWFYVGFRKTSSKTFCSFLIAASNRLPKISLCFCDIVLFFLFLVSYTCSL
jgi:hypothetical protein